MNECYTCPHCNVVHYIPAGEWFDGWCDVCNNDVHALPLPEEPGLTEHTLTDQPGRRITAYIDPRDDYAAANVSLTGRDDDGTDLTAEELRRLAAELEAAADFLEVNTPVAYIVPDVA